MPKQNRGKRQTGKKTRSSRVRRSQRKPPSRPQASGSFGRAFATGVRTLVSCLPGSTALLPVTDFVLKAIGLTMVKPQNGFFADVQNTALGAKFTIGYLNILAGTKNVVNKGRTPASQGNRQMFTTPFLDARLIEVVISVSPVNVIGKRSGDWTIAFYPFYTLDDMNQFKGDKKIPDRTGIERAPIIATGSASQPLSLKYSPKITDGEIFKFHPINDTFGGICIRFNDMNRSTYSEFNGEDFAMDMVLKGRVELRTINPDALDNYSYTDAISDVLQSMTHQILHVPTDTWYFVKANEIVEKNKASQIRGDFDIDMSLGDLEIT